MATQVTQFYFLQDPPIGGGNDWEVIILGPNGGNAEISFDNGATWLQANQGYEDIDTDHHATEDFLVRTHAKETG